MNTSFTKIHRIAAGAALAEGIAPDAMTALLAYEFPGNVRELENLIERAYALGARDQIRLADFPALGGAPASVLHILVSIRVFHLENRPVGEAAQVGSQERPSTLYPNCAHGSQACLSPRPSRGRRLNGPGVAGAGILRRRAIVRRVKKRRAASLPKSAVSLASSWHGGERPCAHEQPSYPIARLVQRQPGAGACLPR